MKRVKSWRSNVNNDLIKDTYLELQLFTFTLKIKIIRYVISWSFCVKNLLQTNIELRKSEFLSAHPDVTSADLERLLEEILYRGISPRRRDLDRSNWSLGQSFLFTVTVVTTIGMFLIQNGLCFFVMRKQTFHQVTAISIHLPTLGRQPASCTLSSGFPSPSSSSRPSSRGSWRQLSSSCHPSSGCVLTWTLFGSDNTTWLFLAWCEISLYRFAWSTWLWWAPCTFCSRSWCQLSSFGSLSRTGHFLMVSTLSLSPWLPLVLVTTSLEITQLWRSTRYLHKKQRIKNPICLHTYYLMVVCLW